MATPSRYLSLSYVNVAAPSGLYPLSLHDALPILVTTLTKRMAEDLTDYLGDHGVKVRYLHSDIDTVERVEIIRDLRIGAFDVLVDRKSTRLNSSHVKISYAVFCLKKKKSQCRAYP